MTPNEIYTNYIEGKHIDDISLVIGIIFYNDLNNKLSQCGPVFQLAAAEANKVYWGLRDYATSRKLKVTLPRSI